MRRISNTFSGHTRTQSALPSHRLRSTTGRTAPGSCLQLALDLPLIRASPHPYRRFGEPLGLGRLARENIARGQASATSKDLAANDICRFGAPEVFPPSYHQID